MPRVTGSSGDGVQAVVLAMQILEILAQEGKPMGVSAMAVALGTTKSRIWRYLQTLVQHGYIVQVQESERYQLGSRLIRLGQAVGDGIDVVTAGARAMRDLRDSLGHSTVITRAEPDGVRVLTTVPGKSTLEIGVKAGSLLDFHCSAQGKIALAFGNEALRAAVMTMRLERRTHATIVNPGALRKEVERVRRNGWAIAPNEIVIGLNALAAPIFDASGLLVGILAIVDSVQFIPEKPTAEQINKTVSAARQVSTALGYVME
ncbi:IclR family transcriptional regulator [Bradyrhizobium prioriisuperbiae]|uniref:IclR family transcriptional regulator n=1 Tax=Bradyrhizobium prioriisuperbiae TaxID=2854389 RepID=UPI0028E4111C|nr:IclR family transcriptional regulator [Bradyrhizobium prioritasuperba]